ncbi:putative transposase for the insertion element IS2404, partial [Mycobacterium ulcerans str. Harvey]
MGSYFTAHVASSDPSGLVPIALDGKMLRGALRAKATATHLVSVFATVPDWCSVNSLSPRKAMKFPAYVPCSRCCRITCGAGHRGCDAYPGRHREVDLRHLKSHYLMIVKSNQAKILAVSPRCRGP